MIHYWCRVSAALETDDPCGYERKGSDPSCADCARSPQAERTLSLRASLAEVQRTWHERWRAPGKLADPGANQPTD